MRFSEDKMASLRCSDGVERPIHIWQAPEPQQPRAVILAIHGGMAHAGDYVTPALTFRRHGIATTIPERDDQIAHRRKKPGRPIDFGEAQRERYKGRNVVERCFNKLKQWRGLAMRSDKYARNYHAGICLAATLDWLRTGFSNTPYDRARNRGCRHPHAARILAQGWTRILWRCWHDHQPYNPDLHGRLNTLQQEAA